MATDTVTIAQFIKEHKITSKAERTARNPNMEDSANMDHWKVTLYRTNYEDRATMTVYFSMGYGHHGKQPDTGSVLDCLASDAASIDNARGFEDWANDFGYDTDSRKAEKTYNICKHEAERLKNFLGTAARYAQLLYDTERL